VFLGGAEIAGSADNCPSGERLAGKTFSLQFRSIPERRAAIVRTKDLLVWVQPGFAPGAAARAALTSGIGQWRNAPFVKGQDAGDYAWRFTT
jgi:hypothetical protein